MIKDGFIMIDHYGHMPPLGLDMPMGYFDYTDEVYMRMETSFWSGVKVFRTIIRGARQNRAVMVCSGTFQECLAVAVIGTWPREKQPVVAMFGDMFGGKHPLRRWLLKRLIKAMDRALDAYIVQSSDELTLFPELWDVDPSKMRLALFGYTFDEDNLDDSLTVAGDYVFAGGNSRRDYGVLLDVARELPDQKFIFATSTLKDHPDIPPNVTAKFVSQIEYIQLMQGSALVITPLQQGLFRAAGQQTYLNAMRLGKVNIVNTHDVLGVGDYIEHGKTGLTVDGSVSSYVEAIQTVLDPANKVWMDNIRAAGLEVAANNTYQDYTKRLMAAARDTILASDKPAVRGVQPTEGS